MVRPKGRGVHDGAAFLVLPLLGPNLAEIRKKGLLGVAFDGRMTPEFAMEVGCALLDCIQVVHE